MPNMKLEPHQSLDIKGLRTHPRDESLQAWHTLHSIVDSLWRKAFTARSAGSRGTSHKFASRARKLEKKMARIIER